tara:strand:+ start:637 stop:879 length:243 start_codon:yes stop_codon:yes gene_type:complete
MPKPKDVYRERFPKGPDWEEPKPNPFQEGASRISANAYHGMEVIGVSMEKYKELEDKVKELETELYFCRRNRKIEEIVNG